MRDTIGLLAASLLAACAADADLETEDVGVVGQPLSVASSLIWHKLNIPVCFENPGAASSTWKGWVRSAVEGSWETVSRVNFTGWGTCSESSMGVRIWIVDGRPASLTGTDIDGAWGGMMLNSSYIFYGFSSCNAQIEACTRATAVHEFGHALGFEHEQTRSDTPSSCTASAGGTTEGDRYVGAWDLNSVMNYCNPDSNDDTLSPTDIIGLRQYYGWEGFAGNRKAAVEWPNGKVYFFNGGQYTRADAGNKKADAGYPASIPAFWGNWPSGWSDGVDAAILANYSYAYFFRGSQYLKYDVLLDRVVSGYPKPIAGNWGNWPSTWTSVDAAVAWDNGKAYFFRGSHYLRVDLDTKRVDDGYPKLITSSWPGLPSDLDLAFRLDDKAYFFKGTTYVRVDTSDFVVDGGYPANIVGNWSGVPF